MIAGCRGSGEAAESRELSDLSASQVKPAVAPAANEPEILEPDTEPVDLPRGVSAPTPHDLSGLGVGARVASAEPAAAHEAKPASKAKAAALADPPKAEAQQALEPAKLAQPAASQRAAAKVSPAQPAAPKPTAHRSAVGQPPRAAAPVASPPAPSVQPDPPVPQEPIAPAPAPKESVSVPHTDHVHVEVPAGLQHWLDEDDRMKPWLGKAVNVADACYANVRADDASASGVIVLSITMHENARPSGRVSSVSGPIKSIVMCATTRLLGVKMPLFTGTEGDSYSLRVRFDP